MLAHFQQRVEQLARMTMLTDVADLPGLVALQEQATSLASELDEGKASEVAELARQIGKLAEGIVLRTLPDVDAAFQEIGKVIDRLQSSVPPSGDAAALPVPDASSTTTDMELVSSWISSCDGMLSELEGHLLSLEKTPDDKDVIGEIRRTMHTLKGECGVLSFHIAQRLCHEAESLIDSRLIAGQTIPIDPFLSLLDWFKAYVQALASNPSATPADHLPILQAIETAQGKLAAEPGQIPTAPTPPAAPPAKPEASPQAQEPAPSPSATVQPTEPDPRPTPSNDDATPSDIASPAETTLVTCAPQPGTEENLADFLCEAKDHLANSEEALLALDQDRSNTELINTVFRAFHTIKGVAGFMALKPIVALAHSAEYMLDGARSGTIALGRPELDLILASCDMMTRLLGVLEGGKGPSRAEYEALVRKVDLAGGATSGGTNTQPAATPLSAQSTPTNRTEAEASQRSDAPSPSSAVTKTETPALAETKPVPKEPAPSAEPDHATGAKLRKSEQTVKVNTNRMDNLVTMVGELVIAQQMVVQDIASLDNAGPRVQRTLGHMSKMIRDLQEVSMSLRMVNLKATFQKMTRLVRDVSQKAGKQIDILTEGEDVELDRNVIEAIADPLVHMIRNSCDHGIEPSDERRAAGKNPVGRVTLRAYHAGGSIVIEIADDGRGLRREKLLAKAKSKGIIPADLDEATMPDSEVFNLIFLPGFSTAEKVTDISGRGVGMDVVRRNIEALRGKIEIRSTPGQGTTFLLRLPLTMAIIDGMLVRVGSQRYVLPTLTIQQSFRPQPKDIKTAVGVGEMVRVRGTMLPVYRLNRVLHLNEGITNLSEALLVVMEADDARFCLMVDDIIGQQQVVIKALNHTGQRVPGVSGGAILGDGRVALILDIAQIASLAKSCSAPSADPTSNSLDHDLLSVA